MGIFMLMGIGNFAQYCTFKRAITEKPYNVMVSNFTWIHNFILRIFIPSLVEF